MLIHKNKKAFTLVEILLWIIIVSMVMVSAFQALTAIWIGKVRLMQKTQTQKQVLYFSEKLFEMIKYWGTIDYEEYFARKVRKNFNIWSNTIPNSEYLSWHYEQSTWFGNYSHLSTVWSPSYNFPWLEYYYCESPSATLNAWNGCYSSYLATWNPQTYWQYSFQFIDYNSDGDSSWDEDGINWIIWDDDDEYLGEWPDVFTMWSDTKELYLINGVKRERTFFRYNVKFDPDRPAWAPCNTTDSWSSYTWSGCLWTIEYLKLEWRDWWLDHDVSTLDTTQYDWVIDTWIIDPQFTTGWTEIIAGSNTIDYWQPLFSDNINVTEFKVFPHPNIDMERAWKVSAQNQNVAEYVRVQLWMMPSWKERKKIKWTPQEFKMSTTINLTDIFTR